jgi:hypothetical protein
VSKMTSKRLELDYSNILITIFELMLRAGVHKQDLEMACSASLRKADARSSLSRKDETGGLVTAALVLDAWHRDRRYLTPKAVPRAVALLGPAPSVEALIRLQRPRRNAAEIARRLKALKLIVRSGARYKPASDVAIISSENPLVLQHAARALSTLLETVGQNVSNHRRPAPLIERVAEVPDLPRRHVAAFQNFTQMQGEIFLRTINDWLESRRSIKSRMKGGERTVRAGVHTYAYVAPKRRRP